MNTILLVVVIAVIALAAFMMMKGGGKNSVSTQDVAANKDKYVLIDVREPAELRNEGYIEGSKNIPMGSIENNLRNIPKDKEVVIYCRSGNRSGVVAAKLSQLGYTNVKNMAGGIMKWKAEGLPVK